MIKCEKITEKKCTAKAGDLEIEGQTGDVFSFSIYQETGLGIMSSVIFIENIEQVKEVANILLSMVEELE